LNTHRRRFAIVLLGAVLAFGPLAAAETPSEEDQGIIVKAFGLEISSGADLALQIRVNDVLVSQKTAGATAAQSIPIQGEILPGENRIEISIGTAEIPPQASPTSSTARPDDTKLTVRLQEDTTTEPKPGMYKTEVADLQAKSWEPDRAGAALVLPQRLTMTFMASDTLEPPIWTRAAQREVAAMQADLERAYAGLIDMLREGDVERLGQTSRKAYAEAARAYPLGGDADARERSDIAEIKSIATDPDVSFPAFEAPLKCVGYAENRLFECFAEDGEPPVRAVFPGESPIFFRFLFSVLENRLMVVR